MKLKVVSWNVWFDGYMDEISTFLDSSSPDIIGLQEVVPNDPGRDVISYLKDRGYQCVFSPVLTLKDGRIMSNAVFSKYPIVKNQTHKLSEDDSRFAIQADLDINGKILHVFSTHLLHTHQQPSETQAIQAKNLVAVVPTENTIVMGDFNATPESVAIQTMRQTFVDTDPSDTPTWCVYELGCPVCLIDVINIRLDYIFISKDMKWSDFRVEDSKGSDHLPVSVVVEI